MVQSFATFSANPWILGFLSDAEADAYLFGLMATFSVFCSQLWQLLIFSDLWLFSRYFALRMADLVIF